MTLSIIVPTYNRGACLAESLPWLKEQVIRNRSEVELIVCDNASTDNTDDVVAEYQAADNRIKYFKNEKNCGAAVSRNKALREAKGRWIAFLDSDDLWVSEKLEKQLKFMVENGYHFSYHNSIRMAEDMKPMGKRYSGPRKVTQGMMYRYCWIGCLTVMYDSLVIGSIQIEDIKKNNDYAIWLKVCHKADCYLLDEILAKYRVRTGSISRHSKIDLIK